MQTSNEFHTGFWTFGTVYKLVRLYYAWVILHSIFRPEQIMAVICSSYEQILYGCQPKNRGFPPKWMVKIIENPIKMDDLGGFPIFLETPICYLVQSR